MVNELEDMTGDKLRAIADWLDTYDRMALLFVADKNPSDEVLWAINGDSVQNDLRRWAEALDGH